MTNIVPLKTGGTIAGIIPTTIEEVFRLATAVAKSGMAPAGMNTAEKLSVAIMHGLEVGLPPMLAIQRISVINGRPSIWGEAVPALLQARGFRLVEHITGTGDARTAHCKVIRPDGASNEATFSVSDARQAKLWGKPGPWQQYPDRMLQMRARGFATRDGAADVLAGLYMKEEAEDIAQALNARKTSAQCKRDGTDKVFNKLVADIETIQTVAELDALMAANKDDIDTMYPRWHEIVMEAHDLRRKDLTTTTVTAEEFEEVEDETAEARAMIETAINLEMLEHVRRVYEDADWESLADAYDAKAADLQAVAQ